MFSSTAIEIIDMLKFAVAKAKVFPHLEAWVCVGRRIPHVKGYNSTLHYGFVIPKNNCVKKKLFNLPWAFLYWNH
jgi:hypothetical protein